MKEHYLMKVLVLILSSIVSTTFGLPQTKLLGGPCEGCEAIFEFGERKLTSVEILPEFDSEGVQIKVTGTVFKQDGITPAEGVILYVYQTNEEGVYPKKGDEKGWARRHGYLRGWVKTGKDGLYTILTQKPRFYGSVPAHIHLTVLEPDGSYYYVEDFMFEGDEYLTGKFINNPSPRGGSTGVMDLKEKEGILTGMRDIVLRKNL